MRQTIPAFSLLALLTLPLHAEEARWSRAIAVDHAGAVAVALEGRAAERAELDLEVIAPDGRALEARVERYEAQAQRPVRVLRVLPQAQGWQVELDAGSSPPWHDRLRFSLARETAAQGVLLEGSSEGKSWQELARSDLFRLGSGASLQGFLLHYESSNARYLRLAWPQAAGLPELLETAVLPVEKELAQVKIETSCHAGAGHLDCRVELPTTCRALRVTLASRPEALGFAFWRAEAGEWQDLGGGERRSQGELRLGVPEGGAYRLRLEGAGAAPPTLLAATCQERRPWLSFEAETPGTYHLTYGRLLAPELRLGTDQDAREEDPAQPALLPLGPEIGAAAAPWPRAAAPGTPLEGEFAEGWPVETSAGKGQLVQLPLPGNVLNTSFPAANGLRLDAAGAQLPYLAEVVPAPELLLAQVARPVQQEGRKSRFELHVPEGTRDAELFLFAHGPFERTLRFTRREPAAPGRAEKEIEIAPRTSWTCSGGHARSCQLHVSLGAAADFAVEIDDGDNPPLPELEAELWTRRQVLYFVHPGGNLVLRASSKLSAPHYDFAALAPYLVRQEASPATLGPALPVEAPAEAPRWVLMLVLGLAALALLAVLARRL